MHDMYSLPPSSSEVIPNEIAKKKIYIYITGEIKLWQLSSYILQEMFNNYHPVTVLRDLYRVKCSIYPSVDTARHI